MPCSSTYTQPGVHPDQGQPGPRLTTYHCQSRSCPYNGGWGGREGARERERERGEGGRGRGRERERERERETERDSDRDKERQTYSTDRQREGGEKRSWVGGGGGESRRQTDKYRMKNTSIFDCAALSVV